MKLIIDAMGGDSAPLEIVKGALSGQKRWGVDVTLTGDTAAILQALVAAQEPEGGFGLTVGNSDVDLTAMTLQALAPYQNSTVTYTGTSGESVTIREVVRRALAWLSDQQTAEGDFISWDAANLESTAQVIIALCSLGVDPATDARFVKNGISAVDGLMRYRLDDGTFRHIF